MLILNNLVKFCQNIISELEHLWKYLDVSCFNVVALLPSNLTQKPISVLDFRV